MGGDIDHMRDAAIRTRMIRRIKAVGFEFVPLDREDYRRRNLNPPAAQTRR